MTMVASPAFFKSLFEKASPNYDHDEIIIFFTADQRRYALNMKRKFLHDNKLPYHPDDEQYGKLPKYSNKVMIAYEIHNVFKIAIYSTTIHPPKIRNDDGPEINADGFLYENFTMASNLTIEDVEHLLLFAALSEDISVDYIP